MALHVEVKRALLNATGCSVIENVSIVALVKSVQTLALLASPAMVMFMISDVLPKCKMLAGLLSTVGDTGLWYNRGLWKCS